MTDSLNRNLINTDNEKKQLRKKMLALRDRLTRKQVGTASRACLENILSFPFFKDHEWIYFFLAFNKEIDTLSMMEAFRNAGKRLAVPRVEGKEMHFYEIRSLDDCRPGAMGILEPYKEVSSHGNLLRVTEPGLMLMPGLAFDKDRNRLGYGGGFYDRYLCGHEGLRTVGICYDFQIIDHVPAESHDLRPEALISDRRILF